MYNNKLSDYKNYLVNELGYSDKTVDTYLFYTNKLEQANFDYRRLLNSYGKITNNTKRVILSALKNFYHFQKNDLYHEITLPKKEKNLKQHLKHNDYLKLVESYRKLNKTSRVKLLIIRMLFETGIRSSELLHIKISDIDEQKIVINGKNRKQRIIYISKNLEKLISEFVQYFELKEDDYLFNFSYRNLHKMIKLMGAKINVELSPHMFRRGFATYCMDQNIGIYEISLMLGHENINTTKMYLRNEDKIKIMKSIFN